MMRALDEDDISLFRTRHGKSVHIQDGVVYRDILNQVVSKEDINEANTSMIGWMMYERRKSICGQYSASGGLDPGRGEVGWCEDTELCMSCMEALGDEGRCKIFEELTARER